MGKRKTSKNEEIIRKLLSHSSPHKAVLISLKNDQQIDSENVIVHFLNEIGCISNDYLHLLLTSLRLTDGTWIPFWTRCKHHALEENNGLQQQLFENCYRFATLVIASNNPTIVAI